MSTIKFIVEIDEQYVHDHAKPTKLKELMEDGSKNDFMKGLADMIGFFYLEKKVDAGTTEFTINRETIDQKANSIFGHVLSKLAVLADIAKKNEEEEKSEQQ